VRGRPRKLSIDQEQLHAGLFWKTNPVPVSPEPLTFTLQRYTDSLKEFSNSSPAEEPQFLHVSFSIQSLDWSAGA
jgi:hypothetical protein